MDKCDKLIKELEAAHKKNYCEAHKLEFMVDTCWWASVVAAALASVSGLLPLPPYLPLPSWGISLLAASASGAELLRRNTKWRERSNVYYSYGDAAWRLANRLKFEIAHPVTPDQLAHISKEFRTAQEEFGKQMAKLNLARDARSKQIGPK